MIVGMENPNFDPGLTQQFTAPLRRVVNKDGSFNVVRQGATWRDLHPYLHLIDDRWPRFLALLFLSFVTVSALFALA
jgi:inward rectifier potassium channel